MSSLAEIECETISARNLLVLCGSSIESLYESLVAFQPEGEDCQVCGAVLQGIFEAKAYMNRIQVHVDAMAKNETVG